MWALLNEDRSDVEQVIINPVHPAVGGCRIRLKVLSALPWERLFALMD